jgi:hypothetical protein
VSVAAVTISGGDATLLVGETRQLVAATIAARGATLTGRVVTWRSSNASVGTISEAGLLVGVASGSTTISATSDGQSGTVTITVVPVPVASVVVNAPSTMIKVGQTLQLSASARDSIGGTLVGREILWTSSDSSKVLVSNAGLVSGLSVGTVSISATSAGSRVSATISITVAEAPAISGVTPTTLTAGQTATIIGTGFAPTTDGNSITVRGVPATIISASSTLLRFLVPCVNSGTAPIEVGTVIGVSRPLTAALAVTQRPLAIGESVILTTTDDSVCNELPSAALPARYLVVVSSAGSSANTVTDFLLSGNTPSPGASKTTRIVPMTRDLTEASAPRTTPHVDDAHVAHLERERALYASLQARGGFRERSSRSLSQGAVSARSIAAPALGELRSFYYNFGGCRDSTNTFRGRAIYVGPRSVIWEDSANALQSKTDSVLAGFYARLGQLFDTEQYAVIRSVFGDPLRRDALLDNDGRLQMVFTQKLNSSGIMAYVTACDQTVRNTTTSAASNVGELFYGAVPTSVGSNVNSTAYSDGWFYFMNRTVVHEVKHIASMAARVASGAPAFEASWLEEATARHAEEIWVRSSLHRLPWKGNAGYGSAGTNGVYCDFNPANETCNAGDALRRPSYGMRRHFDELRPKLLEPWNWSPYGDATGQSGSVFYQSAWSLVRYAIDRYGRSDADFLGALTSSVTSGTANLEAVSGVPMERLIGGWGLALFADDYPGLGTGNADVAIPTWNMRDIYAGLHADPLWSARWNTLFPIAPLAVPFGVFETSRSGLRSGAHAYFELSGTAATTQLLQLRNATGGRPSADLRLSILRLQ